VTIKIYELCGASPNPLFSPHCWKERMSLAHKGLEFEVVPTPFTEVTRVENGFAKTVPILRDGERLVSDSYEIALYLEEQYPNGASLFGDSAGRALSRFVAEWADAQIRPVIGKARLLEIFEGLAPSDQSYFRTTREKRFGMPLERVASENAASLETLPELMHPVEAVLTHQPYLGGETPLFADYAVFGYLQWPHRVSTRRVFKANSQIAKWLGRLLNLYDGMALPPA
jgi:glutathione S-transferase